MTLIQIQDQYIQAVLKAHPKVRHMARGKAARRVHHALHALGFTWAQRIKAIADANDIIDLELIAQTPLIQNNATDPKLI